jgi:type I restriction-modification system DNA methylase subunit
MVSEAASLAASAILLAKKERQELAYWVVESTLSDYRAGYSSLPREVSAFLLETLGVETGDEVILPQPNVDFLTIECMQLGARARVVGGAPPVLSAIFAAIAGHEFDYTQIDTYGPNFNVTKFNSSKFSVVAPAFGQRSEARMEMRMKLSRFAARTSEAQGVELAMLLGKSRSAVVVPPGFLFSRPETDLRRHLIDTETLDAVVSFTSGLLAHTSLPFSALILSKDKPRPAITFCKIDDKEHVDGQGKLRSRRRFTGGQDIGRLLKRPDGRVAVTVDRNQVQAGDALLLPERYLQKRARFFEAHEAECVALGELFEVIKPQLLSESGDDASIAVREIGPGELPQFTYLTSAARERWVDSNELYSRANQIIQSGDVLLSTKGTIGKVGLARLDSDAQPVLPSLSCVILRPKSSARACDSRYLAMYLRSPAVQELLDSMAVGATIRNIALGELRSLPVWVPSVQKQREFVSAFEKQSELEIQMQDLAAEQARAATALWEQMELTGNADSSSNS